ncbi:DUF3391 domain-containing protein [Psychrobium sp. 1_MG-2023]|uniref:HD-GYP domain-containing protein n=1 Tax=Psychrobium sp. 1_MG-2023 TaxID=3062624 RepID=UPI000C322A64|nr:DUF3391 domain-containing protein [Psychrobium sp. 1_MG-2023]MDP2560228.1 DUF3391 domain-containing protein [Psychrobium sp. 1_MG-2023]PKF57038.1 HD family phosphohydrolase [Alteromonadales bacterium alter-6D02]
MANQARIKLTIQRLQPGIFIEIPVGWNEHPFMFNRFKITSQKQIAMLNQANISHVYAIPHKSTANPLPAIEESSQPPINSNVNMQPQLDELTKIKQKQIEAMQGYRRSLKKCEGAYQIAVSQVRSLTSKIKARPLLAMQEAEEVISSMAEALMAKDDLVLHLVGDDRDDIDIHQHAISVSLLSMMIGNYLKYDKQQIEDLGTAGLLHDIGKMKIPSQFYTGKDVSPAKRKFVTEKHTEYSVEYLNNAPNISDNVKQLVLEHHEFADGSGYPSQLTADKLNPLSLVISLVNYYDNLCYPLDESKAKSPSQALSFLFKNKAHLFDPQQLGAFVKTMGVYPPGTFVRLNTDQIGIVITVNSNKLLYPNVMVYDENIPRDDAAIINIEDEEGIAIESAISGQGLPEQVRSYLNPRSRISFFIE